MSFTSIENLGKYEVSISNYGSDELLDEIAQA